MRRGLAGLLFFIAAVLLSVAAGGWWFQRVAFDPATSRGAADAIVEVPEVRAELSSLVATAAADRVGTPPDQLAALITEWLPLMVHDRQAAAVIDDVITQAHRKLVGARSEPVQITGLQMVQLTRNENAWDLPTVELAIEEVSWLASVRTVLVWLVPATAIAGLIATVLGILAHPNRADAIFGIGVFCVLAAVLAFVLGYVVPAYAITLLTDEPWANLIPAVAEANVKLIGGLSVVLAIVGSVLVFSSVGFRRRKTKGWSTPVRRATYQTEQRQWSR